MLFDNNLFTVEKRLLSILLMTIGSVAISFNGLVLRNIEIADNWTIIFYRALSFSFAIFIYLFFMYKKRILKKIIQIGINGLIGGFVLAYGVFHALYFLDTIWIFNGFVILSITLIFLMFGQRITKDYVGAADLVPYFILIMLGIMSMY